MTAQSGEQIASQIGANLPYLRRYARALTGSQQAGDRCVRLFLESLLAEGEDLPEP